MVKEELKNTIVYSHTMKEEEITAANTQQYTHTHTHIAHNTNDREKERESV